MFITQWKHFSREPGPAHNLLECDPRDEVHRPESGQKPELGP